MTIKEIFDYVREVKINSFSDKTLTVWLNELEGKIQNEIMLIAQPECVKYYYASETELSWIGFNDDHTVNVPVPIKAHVGGKVSIQGLSEERNNVTGKTIRGISDDGLTLSFDAGTFVPTESDHVSDCGIIYFDGSETEPLVKYPFERIYPSWLLMKISQHLEESSQDANYTARFKDDWEIFAGWYAETYRPADGVPTFKGYYLRGERGERGERGLAGTGIVKTEIVDGHIVVTYSDGTWEDTGEISGGGTSDHSQLTSRDAADQHPMSAITGLVAALGEKANTASLSPVATSGSYDDLTGKPTIPSEVTEDTVSGWGFTKNTGTYSKPNEGIPKTDLASGVQTSLGKADTALQQHQDISGKEDKANKVTTVDVSSTDTQYPSAKAVYDMGAALEQYVDEQSSFIVTMSYDGQINHVDKTYAEILAAYTAKKVIILRIITDTTPYSVPFAGFEDTTGSPAVFWGFDGAKYASISNTAIKVKCTNANVWSETFEKYATKSYVDNLIGNVDTLIGNGAIE